MQDLIIKIPIKNAAGDIVGEKEVVSYAGLLARAHDEGLDAIETTVLQVPSAENAMTAVVRAVVRGKRGTFTGIGDASPDNVNRRIAKHVLRMAETRAKARALRDFVNVGTVALEELGGGDDEVGDEVATPAAPVQHAQARVVVPARTNGNGRSRLMSDAQRRMLWRQAMTLGYSGAEAATFLRDRLGTEIETATKDAASRLISDLEQQIAGATHAAE